MRFSRKRASESRACPALGPTLFSHLAVAMGLSFAGSHHAFAQPGQAPTNPRTEPAKRQTHRLDPSFYEVLPQGLTHDFDTDLGAVMPAKHSEKACQNYWQALDPVTEKWDPSRLPHDGAEQARANLQAQMILCGKWLFFYLPVPSQVAIPDILLKSLLATFPEITGPAFEKVGLRENPRRPGEPLELPVIPRNFSVVRGILSGPGRTMACTGCHLGKTPDGRFSVGMPNDALDLGLFNTLSAYPLWLASRQKSDTVPWDGHLQSRFEEWFEASKGRVNLPRALLDSVVLLDLLNLEKSFYAFVGQDPLPETDQRTFYKSGRGRLNPSTPMLSEPHHELYVSAPPIWKMKHHEDSEINEPYLGRVVSSRNLEEFIRQAMVFTTLETRFSTPRYVDPLAAYLRTLMPPQNPQPRKPTLFAQGQALFMQNCVTCHNGYEGATSRNHALDDVLSPLVFDAIFQDYIPPTRQSKLALAGLQKVGMLPLERSGIKSRRFTGLWARQRLTTAGTVEGLDALFCLGGTSRQNLDRHDALSDATHLDLCEDYTTDEKRAFKEYLSQNW